jgi:hypothetical protein
VGGVTIIAEERHELGTTAEASVDQVHIRLAGDSIRSDEQDRAGLARPVFKRAEHWARLWVAERHTEIAD